MTYIANYKYLCIFFRYLIAFVGNTNEPLWRGYFYVFLMMLTATLQTLILSQYFHRMYLVGMRVRTALTSAIYRKVNILIFS